MYQYCKSYWKYISKITAVIMYKGSKRNKQYIPDVKMFSQASTTNQTIF